MKTTRFLRRVAVTLVLATAGAPIVATAALPGHATAAESTDPLRRIGTLPEPAARSGPGSIAAIDAKSHRMYYVYTDDKGMDHIVTYDTRPRIPQPGPTATLFDVRD